MTEHINEQLNLIGKWVPDIPLPLYGRLREQCYCGKKFWTHSGYRGHYALVHILRLTPSI
jgi:hypothetical protein